MPTIPLNSPTDLVFAILIGLALAILWVFQFARLMSLADDDFPGQYARFGWVAGFVVLWFITPFAFLLWNAGRQSAGRRERSRRGAAD